MSGSCRLRDDEHVRRRLGVDVLERDRVLGLADDLGRDVTRDDLAEQAVVCHC